MLNEQMTGGCGGPTVGSGAGGAHLGSRRLAAIDIGTVTTRLLVGEVTSTDVIPLERRARITQLGEGVAESHHLKPEAMQRVLQTVREYRAVAESLGATSLLAVATSAARDADNAAEFRDLLASEGVDIGVIAGEREAELSFLGAASSFPGEGLLVVDIGGGSAEIVEGNIRRAPEGDGYLTDILVKHSFNIGCRRATELFIASDPPDPAELAAERAWVLGQMGSYFKELPQRPRRMLAVAGTATTVVSVGKHMVTYDSSQVHGTVVDAAMLRGVTEELSHMTLEQRKATAGLEPGRAGIIVAGLVILGCVLELSGLPSFTVSESDILQGMLLSC